MLQLNNTHAPLPVFSDIAIEAPALRPMAVEIVMKLPLSTAAWRRKRAGVTAPLWMGTSFDTSPGAFMRRPSLRYAGRGGADEAGGYVHRLLTWQDRGGGNGQWCRASTSLLPRSNNRSRQPRGRAVPLRPGMVPEAMRVAARPERVPGLALSRLRRRQWRQACDRAARYAPVM